MALLQTRAYGLIHTGLKLMCSLAGNSAGYHGVRIGRNKSEKKVIQTVVTLTDERVKFRVGAGVGQAVARIQDRELGRIGEGVCLSPSAGQ